MILEFNLSHSIIALNLMISVLSQWAYFLDPHDVLQMCHTTYNSQWWTQGGGGGGAAGACPPPTLIDYVFWYSILYQNAHN